MTLEIAAVGRDDFVQGFKLVGVRKAISATKEDLEKKHEDLRDDVKEIDDAFEKFARDSTSDFANNEQFQRFMFDAADRATSKKDSASR